MDDSTRNDDLAERLGALGQWHPQSSVGLETVLRAGRRRRAVRVAGMSGLAGALVAAAAVSALALGDVRGTAPATTTRTGAPTVSTSAVPVGEARATMAAAAPDPEKALDESSWADAPYWYVKAYHHQPDPEGVAGGTRDYTSEDWTAHRAHGLHIVDGDMATAYGSSASGWTLDDFDWMGDDVPWDALFALPTDAPALEAELRRAVGDSRDGSVEDKVWGQITDVYPGSPASGALRLAFMQVASELPGTTVTPGVVDRQGRVGLAISRPDVLGEAWSSVSTLIVDPVDGSVLETRMAVPDQDDEYWRSYLAMGPAWTLPAEPTLAGCANWETC